MPDEADRARGADDASRRPPDPRVSRLRPDPAAAPERAVTLRGFFGESDREGFSRLYLTSDLDFYAEFRTDDVTAVLDIPPDRQPFAGEQATEVSIRQDSTVEFTRTRVAKPPDEFDLDVRLARRRRPAPSANRRGGPNAWSAAWTECCLPYTIEDPTCPETCFGQAWTCEIACWSLVGCPTHEGDCFTFPGDTGPHNSQCPPCFPF